MRASFLEILQCPFCGSDLSIKDVGRQGAEDESISDGLLSCRCTTHPIIAGIPVLAAGDIVEAAISQIEAGQADMALLKVLGLDAANQDGAGPISRESVPVTFQEMAEMLGPQGECDYFIYRFSDPTYIVAQAV